MDLATVGMSFLGGLLLGVIGNGMFCYALVNREKRQALYIVRNLAREKGLTIHAVNTCISVLKSELPLPRSTSPVSMERLAQQWFSAWYNSYAATELGSEKEARDIIGAKER